MRREGRPDSRPKALAQIVANFAVVFLLSKLPRLSSCLFCCLSSLSLSHSLSFSVALCTALWHFLISPFPAALPLTSSFCAISAATLHVLTELACPALLRMSWHFYATDKRQRRCYSCLYMSYFPATIFLTSPRTSSLSLFLCNF